MNQLVPIAVHGSPAFIVAAGEGARVRFVESSPVNTDWGALE
jgi:hypothetical protein